MTPDTLFRVYCTIKPVAALAVANLVDAGLVDLDRPLSESLPSMEALRGGVTARHVLNHTAGLHLLESAMTSSRAARASVTTSSTAKAQRRDGGSASMRDTPRYSAGSALARLIETVTEEPLRDHLRRSVLDPLGMEQTTIGLPAEDDAATITASASTSIFGFAGPRCSSEANGS